ncbi:arginine--tRNA ligase [Haliangium sp.]|uniref:arginine--tRNA ligase n=1 Tax=Haliangium sp. TaxID=2663208 RepID=UPI003D127752
MQDVLNPFAAACARAVGSALGLDPDLFQVGAPPRPELGDFAVGCFPAAKRLKQPPPALAARVAAGFSPDEHLSEATATGPFVNFRANRAEVFRWLFEATTDAGGPALIPTTAGRGKTVCIDYSSPNISKHLAYHHIRSTVIGHALVEIYRALGYRVVGINHLGDWGTTHGMLLAAYELWGAPEPLTVTALNDLYVRFRAAMKADPPDAPVHEHKGRAWFKRLEDGDPEARRLWQHFREVSLAEFQEVYDQLGIRFDEVRGESAYEDDMPKVLALLAERGLSAESEGALVVPLDDVDMPPMLLRKQDGATLYGTRDLAAAIYRHDTHGFTRSLYVVDRGQSLHFRQLFEVLRRAGFDWADRCAHVPFGVVRLGGKKTGTRTGNVVLLKEVLAEAANRAEEVVRAANADMDAEAVSRTARAVGVGAVVFANLVTQREKDIDFSWEQVLSTTGDAGPYVQYAHARCASILRKAGERGLAPDASADSTGLGHDSEWALARKLLDLGEVVHRAAEANEPHLVSRYLLDLCATYSRWYTAGNQDKALRALSEDEGLSRARVTLVAATKEVLRRGLGLLGLEAPDVM